MDLDLIGARQPDYQVYKKKTTIYGLLYPSIMPLYIAIQSQSRHCFILNKPIQVALDCWYNPINWQPSASTMRGRGR